MPTLLSDSGVAIAGIGRVVAYETEVMLHGAQKSHMLWRRQVVMREKNLKRRSGLHPGHVPRDRRVVYGTSNLTVSRTSSFT
jgi:hypothetical protein